MSDLLGNDDRDPVRTLWELVERRAQLTPDQPMLINEQGDLTCGEFLARCRAGRGRPARHGHPARHARSAGSCRPGSTPSCCRSRWPGSARCRTRSSTSTANGGRLRACARPRPSSCSCPAPGAASTTRRWSRELERRPRPSRRRSSWSSTRPARRRPGRRCPRRRTRRRRAVRWIYYTSGTTSDPKGVRHTDGTLIAGGTGLAVALRHARPTTSARSRSRSRTSAAPTTCHDARRRVPGGAVEAFAPDRRSSRSRATASTMGGGSTAFYMRVPRRAAQAAAATPIMPTLRMHVRRRRAEAAGAATTRCSARSASASRHGYGMTEVPDDHARARRTTPTSSSPTPTARPSTGMEIRIVTEDGADAPAGDEGEVRRQGPDGLPRLHRPRPAPPRRFDEDGWFRTGDLGQLRADGHVMLTGRLKDVIIRKGENISRQGDRGPAVRPPEGRRRRRHRAARPRARRAGLRGRRAADPGPSR